MATQLSLEKHTGYETLTSGFFYLRYDLESAWLTLEDILDFLGFHDFTIVDTVCKRLCGSD